MTKIVKLSDRTHVLKRPGRYIGSVTPVTLERPVLEDNKITFKNITYVPALLKIIREIIDNSVDAIIKYKTGDTINVIMNDKYIAVKDNACGIHISFIKDEHGNEIKKLAPEAVWTELKTGSNFEDNATDTQSGQNGEGSTLTNIFSTMFVGETDDGKKHFRLISKNNMKTVDTTITKSTGKTGTQVMFYPDLEKLHLGNNIPEIYQDLLKFELLFLAATFPDITFYYNKEKIAIKSYKELYTKYFSEDIEITETKNVFTAFSTSQDGWKFIHFINGLNVFNGGTLIDYGEKYIIGALYDIIQKRKLKNINKADIKNKLTFHLHIKDLPLPRFADQIKSKCINLPGKFPEIAEQIRDISKSRFIERVYKNKKIIQPIIDLHKAQQLIANEKQLKKKIKGNKISSKYWPAINEKKYLIIPEGDSAVGSILDGLGRDVYGFFPIKGKISNVIKKPKAMQTDNEIHEIIKIMNFLDASKGNYTYDSIVIASDADVDGSHITSLLTAFMYKIAPDILENGKVFRFLTPVIVAYKKDKIEKFFFNLSEYKEYAKMEHKGITYDYKKGLGSLEESEWEYLFKNYKFEELLVPLTIKDDEDIQSLDAWMNEDREYRKQAIKNGLPDFSLDVV